MKKQTIATIIVAGLIALTMFVVKHIQKLDNGIKIKQIELRDNSAQLQLLDDKYKKLNEDLNKTGADKAKIEEQLKQLQEEKKSLQDQLQAKINAKQQDIASNATKALTGSQKASAATPCGDNEYAQYIYMHESGCRINAVNSIGCKGIGQRCGDWNCSLDDYACQNAWFTNYAQSRYGSWYNAYVFWQANRWW